MTDETIRKAVGEQMTETVTGVFALNEKNELLFVWGPKFKEWVIPGGHPKEGETLEECAKRELFEETNLEGSELRKINETADGERLAAGRARSFEYHNFACKASGSVKLDGTELTKFEWIPLDRAMTDERIYEGIRKRVLPKLSGMIDETVRKAVGAVITSKREPGKIVLVHKAKLEDLGNGKVDYWDLPKGGVQPGETDEQALERELTEEIGTANITALRKLPFKISFKLPELQGSNYKTQETALFLAECYETKFTPKTDEISEAKFVKISEALKLIGHEETRQAVRKAVETLNTRQ